MQNQKMIRIRQILQRPDVSKVKSRFIKERKRAIKILKNKVLHVNDIKKEYKSLYGTSFETFAFNEGCYLCGGYTHNPTNAVKNRFCNASYKCQHFDWERKSDNWGRIDMTTVLYSFGEIGINSDGKRVWAIKGNMPEKYNVNQKHRESYENREQKEKVEDDIIELISEFFENYDKTLFIGCPGPNVERHKTFAGKLGCKETLFLENEKPTYIDIKKRFPNDNIQNKCLWKSLSECNKYDAVYIHADIRDPRFFNYDSIEKFLNGFDGFAVVEFTAKVKGLWQKTNGKLLINENFNVIYDEKYTDTAQMRTILIIN